MACCSSYGSSPVQEPLSWYQWWPEELTQNATRLCNALAAIMERMDEQILPAVYNAIGASFHATPSQLGVLTLARALVQALASPLGGILGAS